MQTQSANENSEIVHSDEDFSLVSADCITPFGIQNNRAIVAFVRSSTKWLQSHFANTLLIWSYSCCLLVTRLDNHRKIEPLQIHRRSNHGAWFAPSSLTCNNWSQINNSSTNSIWALPYNASRFCTSKDVHEGNCRDFSARKSGWSCARRFGYRLNISGISM